MRPRALDLPPFLVGIASIPAQALLLREFLARGTGTELSLAFALTVWLAASALGARFWGAAGDRAGRAFAPLIAAGAAAALLGIAVARLLPLPGIVPGEVPGPAGIALLALAVLAPASFLTAGLFPLAARRAGEAGRAYVVEAVGALIGGTATTFLLLARVGTGTILAGVLGMVVAGSLRGRARWIAGLALAALLVSGLPGRLDRALFRAAWEERHPGLRLVRSLQTPTRVLALAEREGERWLFADDEPRAVLDDPYANAAIPALILAAAPRVESVLLIDFGLDSVAGDLAGAGAEVTLLLPESEETLLVRIDPRVDLLFGDPRRSLRRLDRRFDVVVIGGGHALTLASNRLWTAEAFEAIAERLRPGGVALAVSPGGEAAAGRPARAWRSGVAEAIRRTVGPVETIDADRFLFAASPLPGAATFDPDTLAARYRSRGPILPRYPAARFLAEYPRQRIVALPAALPNEDFRPAALTQAVLLWIHRAGLPAPPPGALAAIVGGLILAVFLLPGRGVRRGPAGASRVLIATGAASLGLDLLLLLAYQARVGLLQAGLGLLLGAFLGGTAFGAAIGRRLDPEPPRLAAACLLQAAVGGLVLLLLPSLPIGPAAAASLLYAALAFALGIACGLPFPAVARATSAASAWAADSIGGILGAALVLAFIGWGITAAGIALIALPLLATTRLLGSSARNRGSRRP